MGGYAWWHHYTQGRRCVELWGADVGESIRYAPRVELLRLARRDAQDAESIEVQGDTYAVVAHKDITGTPGLVHARQALIEDASYLWNAELGGAATWQYLLRFTDGAEQISVALDCEQGRVRLVGTQREAALNAHLTKGYQERLPVWLASGANASPTSPAASADKQ